MEKIDINPQLKPLYASILRLGIERYLVTDRFRYLCMENNVDELWEIYGRFMTPHQVLVPGSLDRVKETLGLFLNDLYSQSKERFIKILIEILTDFSNWGSDRKDFSRVKVYLCQLGFPNEVVEEKFLGIEKELSPNARRVESGEVKEIEVSENLCFVLMPFGEEFNPTYERLKKIIEREDLGLECKRADEIFGTRPVIKDIREYIKKAIVIVADLTSRNPNVFYELGYAHALDKRVVLITQNIEDAPFDVRHFRCISYENSIAGANELERKLKETLLEVLGER